MRTYSLMYLAVELKRDMYFEARLSHLTSLEILVVHYISRDVLLVYDIVGGSLSTREIVV